MSSSAMLATSGLAVGGITSLIGSNTSYKAAYDEAAYLREYGDAQYYDSLMEAYETETEARQTKESQTMKYVMSGVSIQGTPMQVLDYTSNQAQMEIEHIKSQGQALRALQYAKAAQTESSARAQLLTSAATSAFKIGDSLSSMSSGGMFNSTPVSNEVVTSLPTQLKSMFGNSYKTGTEYGYTGKLSGLS